MNKIVSSFSFVIFMIALTLLFLMIKKKELEQQTPSPKADVVAELPVELIPEAGENTGSLSAAAATAAVVNANLPSIEFEGEVGEAHPWNSYHGTSALTGSISRPFPESLSPRWQIPAEAAVTGTPVYSGSAIYFANQKGGVFAVDVEGEVLWSAKIIKGQQSDGTNRFADFEVPLLYLDGLLFACDLDGLVVAFDAENGEELWRKFLEIAVEGSPNYRIAPGEEESTDIFLYIIDQSSGALICLNGRNGKHLWTSETEVGRCDAIPGVTDEHVVFGSCASALHIFSSNTGEHLHDLELGNDAQVASGVAIVDGKGLSGSRNGSLVCVDLKEGSTLWTSKLSRGEIFATPAVAGKHVVVGDEDGRLFALALEDGEVLWETGLDGAILSPVIVRDKIALSVEGQVHLLRLVNGEKLWSYELSDDITSPCVAGSLLVVGSSDATVTAFAGNSQGD